MPFFFGIVTPVPGCNFEVFAVFPGARLQGVTLLCRPLHGRRPDLVQEAARSNRCARHCIFQRIGGERRIAHQLSQLGSQCHDLCGNGTIVGHAARFAPGDPGLKGLFTQIPARRKLQKTFNTGARERDRMHIGMAKCGCRMAGRRYHPVRQASEIGR